MMFKDLLESGYEKDVILKMDIFRTEEFLGSLNQELVSGNGSLSKRDGIEAVEHADHPEMDPCHADGIPVVKEDNLMNMSLGVSPPYDRAQGCSLPMDVVLQDWSSFAQAPNVWRRGEPAKGSERGLGYWAWVWV